MQIGETIKTDDGVSINYVKAAQVAGPYKRTAIDDFKALADFRIVSIGNSNTIIWRDGRQESVTDRKLTRLQSAHTWATDF